MFEPHFAPVTDEQDERYRKWAMEVVELFEKARKHPRKTHKAMREMYAMLDSFLADVIVGSPCKKGCNYCCKVPVAMTRLEAEYIKHCYPNLELTLDSGSPLLIAMLRGSTERGMCPFNNGEGCQIYDARPINCRALHSMDDVRLCEEEKAHKLANSKTINFVDGFVQFLGRVNVERWGLENIAGDIRDYFDKK